MLIPCSDHSKASRVNEPWNVLLFKMLHWSFRMIYQERERIIFWEQSWWWFSVMQIKILSSIFAYSANFTAAIVCNRSQWCWSTMAQFFSELQETSYEPCAVWKFLKNDPSSHPGVRWLREPKLGLPGFSRPQDFPPLPDSPSFTQVFPGLAGPRATAERGVNRTSMLRDYCEF